MVIFTSWSKLASLSLKSVAFDASTVKIFCVPSPLENVSPLESRVTSFGDRGGGCSASATDLAAVEDPYQSTSDRTERPYAGIGRAWGLAATGTAHRIRFGT